MIFIVEDLCGNVQATTSSFSTVDTLGPQFENPLPEDITISCDAIPEPQREPKGERFDLPKRPRGDPCGRTGRFDARRPRARPEGERCHREV